MNWYRNHLERKHKKQNEFKNHFYLQMSLYAFLMNAYKRTYHHEANFLMSGYFTAYSQDVFMNLHRPGAGDMRIFFYLLINIIVGYFLVGLCNGADNWWQDILVIAGVIFVFSADVGGARAWSFIRKIKRAERKHPDLATADEKEIMKGRESK